jgi:hypothetical protein
MLTMKASIRAAVIERRRQNPARPILDCCWDAVRWAHFRETLSASVKADKRRSKAAKAGWKKRKAMSKGY